MNQWQEAEMKDQALVSKQEKKPYQKPEITRVELVAEEAVLGGCKAFGYCDTGPIPLLTGGT